MSEGNSVLRLSVAPAANLTPPVTVITTALRR